MKVVVFWTERNTGRVAPSTQPLEQVVDLDIPPRYGEMVKTRTGFLGPVQSVMWILDGEPTVHVVLT